MKTKKNLLKWIGPGVSILLIVWGGVHLVGYISDLVSSRKTTQELREIAAATETTTISVPAEPGEVTIPAPEITLNPGQAATAPEETPKVTAAEAVAPEGAATETMAASEELPAVDYPNGYALVPRIQELRKKSEYIIGWITMDDLDEPVVHRDNTFFLDHDAMGKKNGNGAIFMDQYTNLLTRPYTILVYGHNMKTGAMFGNLRKYEDSSYCFKHRFLQFDTLYEEGKFEIFAVATISLTPGKAKFLDLTALQSSDRNTRKEALVSLQNASAYQGVGEVKADDQILLLITCVGDEDERLIVAARRV